MVNAENLIQYKLFEPFPKLIAFTTTKQSFKNKAVRFTGNSESVNRNNKEELARILGLRSKQLVFPQQTHTNCFAKVSTIPDTELSNTDALISNQKDICICVQTADCVPILLFDPVEKVISVVHAGWRGTVKKIVKNAIQGMFVNYNSLPENILAAIGPSISPEVYEVDSEVISAAKKSIPNAELTYTKLSSGKYLFNLWEANKQLLLSNGVLLKNIEIAQECSFLNNKKYYSARREGINTGRTVSGMLLLR